MLRIISVLVIFVVLALPCHAEEVFLQMNACLHKAAGVHPEMMDCLSAEYDRQDKRLNTAYKKAMSGLTTERKKKLRDAQRAWIAFKEANAAFMDDPDGGQIARLDSLDWNVRATASRAKELEQIAD